LTESEVIEGEDDDEEEEEEEFLLLALLLEVGERRGVGTAFVEEEGKTREVVGDERGGVAPSSITVAIPIPNSDYFPVLREEEGLRVSNLNLSYVSEDKTEESLNRSSIYNELNEECNYNL
jgi:hypothetical protein